jgi:hypothetical protein
VNARVEIFSGSICISIRHSIAIWFTHIFFT